MTKNHILTASFCLAALFATLGFRTIENTDYLRYAEIGRELVETGDWVVPRENGQIYTNKPPVHFWNIALSYTVFGVSPFAARLPSALFATLLLAAAALFTRRASGLDEAAVYAPLVLLSCYGFFFFSHRTRIDMEYAAFFSLSLICLYAGAVARRRKWLLFALFWLLSGLGFMDKGPVVFLNLLIGAVWAKLEQRRATPLRGLMPLVLTAPAVLLPVAPWIYALSRHPEFNHYVAIFKATNSATSHEGLLYYIPQLIAKCTPAVLLLPVARRMLTDQWANNTRIRRPISFLLVWAGVYFIAINLTNIKSHRYLLPMMLPLSILAGWGAARAVREKCFEKYFSVLSRIVVFGLAGFAVATPIIAWYKYHHAAPFIAAAAALIAALLLIKKQFRHALPVMLLSITLLYTGLDFFYTANNTRTSPGREIWKLVATDSREARDVAFYRECGRLRETVSFYADSLLFCTDDPAAARERSAVVMAPEAAATFPQDGYRHLILESPKKKADDVHIFLRNRSDR